MSLKFEVCIIEEQHLEPQIKDAAFNSFPSHWREIPGNDNKRAWTQQEPSYRVVATGPSGEFIGQIGLVAVCIKPVVLGVSDASVDVKYREVGVATALLEAACVFADETDSRLMIATSNKGLRRVCERLGFHAITDEVTLDGYDVIPESWMGRGDLGGVVVNDLF
jgi:hypothetical protein